VVDAGNISKKRSAEIRREVMGCGLLGQPRGTKMGGAPLLKHEVRVIKGNGIP